MNTQSAMAVAEASPRYLLIEQTMTREQEDYLIQRALDVLMKRMKTGPLLPRWPSAAWSEAADSPLAAGVPPAL